MNDKEFERKFRNEVSIPDWTLLVLLAPVAVLWVVVFLVHMISYFLEN